MLKIRLARGGAKKRPFYHIVLADSRSPRDGRFIEKLGTFDPRLPKDHEQRTRVNGDRVKELMGKGAQVTDRVAYILGVAGVLPMPERKNTPKKSEPGAKMTERRREREEKAKAAAEAAEEAKAAAEAPAEEAPAEEAKTEEEKSA